MVNLYHHPYAVRGIRILDSRMAIEYFTNYTITAKKMFLNYLGTRIRTRDTKGYSFLLWPLSYAKIYYM